MVAALHNVTLNPLIASQNASPKLIAFLLSIIRRAELVGFSFAIKIVFEIFSKENT